MTALRYMAQVKEAIEKFDPARANRYFIFGSAARNDTFHDIDLGVVGNETAGKPLSVLRDTFYDSPIPYKVDVVDFDAADPDFREYVIQNESLLWIR